MENKPKFRASYTVLSMWDSGRWEDAISTLFKLEAYENDAMRDGKLLHDAWQKETEETGCLPAVFGGTPLVKPETELKIVVQVYDWLEIVGVIDVYDDGDVHEHKSGVLSSNTYARSKQAGLYAVIALRSGRTAKRLFLNHYNQYDKTADISVVWVTEKLLEETMDWVESVSQDMYNYLIENKLYDRFGKKEKEGASASA